MKKADERKKIKADAEAKAAEVLAQEDQHKMQAKLKDLFNELLGELADAQSEKAKSVEDNTKLTEDLEGLKAEKENIQSQKAELEAQAEDLQKKLDEAEKKISELENQVEGMKQEASLQSRVAELEAEGLLIGGEIADKQRAKIKMMDDEEFADHKAYLSELKAGLAKQLESESKVEDNTDKKSKSEDKSKSSESTDSDESVSAAAILAELGLDEEATKITASKLLKMKKAAAGMNVATSVGNESLEYEGDPLVSSEKLKEYAELWDSMSE